MSRYSSNMWCKEYEEYMKTAPEWLEPVDIEPPATSKQIKFLIELGRTRASIPYGKKACRELISEILDNEHEPEIDNEQMEMAGLSISDLH